MRKELAGCTIDYAYCEPKDLDLAVPAAPQTLQQIMSRYPRSWARAFNALYFYPGKPPVTKGIAWENQTFWSWDEDPWPCFVVYPDGRADILFKPTKDEVRKTRVAFSAGPLLLGVDLEETMRLGGYTGFTLSRKTAQAAVGITEDQKVLHVAVDSATVYELADLMKQAGCVKAMKVDSGSSTSVLYRSGEKFGNMTAVITAAVVMRSVLDRALPVGGTETERKACDGKFLDAPNFSVTEFRCPCCGMVRVSVGFLKLVTLLQKLRDRIQSPVYITSGYRCPARNKAVGGAP
ncbi:MAG: phosphodiester glycosidase family protein, partial [Bacillota bacterium]